MPVPERIWLNTANAPRPSAASVDAPANATPGDSSIASRATAAMRFMALPPCRLLPAVGEYVVFRPLDRDPRASIPAARYDPGRRGTLRPPMGTTSPP